MGSLGRMSKFGLYALAGLAGIAVLILGLERLAAERVEVVELHTTDAAGQPQTTRLWVVDDEGFQYLRVGADGSGWFTRLIDNGQFQLTRQGQRAAYTAVQRPDKSARINQLMQEKYTWGDAVIAVLVGSRDGSIPVELHPR